ncbi:MAG TPA: class III lanthionine synthetase LanKC, partial [Blastocatellia bacterium]|nr:class III lanthionine synthetase LanKC [Blastocatellia bacterium]
VRVLKAAASVAINSDIPFKFALDPQIRSLMCSKSWYRGGSGKFITLYPANLEKFKCLLEELYDRVRDESGPYILSDKRYKDCRALYYRYGGMASHYELDITGQRDPVLLSPDGSTIPDERTPYFEPPAWEANPFHEEFVEDAGAPNVMAGRYAVKSALSFSNSGGVYLADDVKLGREVVIKEARPNTVVDDWGHDAVSRLTKEYQILKLLAPTGCVPEPVQMFEEWEHAFLVEEYIKGDDLRHLLLTRSPLLRVRPTLAESTAYYEMFRTLCKNIISAIGCVHRHGVVFGDISPNNVKVIPGTLETRLIDLETACRLATDDPTVLHTLGYRKKEKPSAEPGTQADDLHAIASVMFYLIFPISALSVLKDDVFISVLRTMLADLGWSETPVFNIVQGLSSGQMSCEEACALLGSPVRLRPPSYAEEVDEDFFETAKHKLGEFLVHHMRPDGDLLFPADPFIRQTNPLSLGFGACGVLYALKKSGIEIPSSASVWLEERLDKLDPDTVPPGLLTGTAGIAWCLLELGAVERAAHLMQLANESRLRTAHHSYFYGMAGIGMANLAFYHRTGGVRFLNAAVELASHLLDQSGENERGTHWKSGDLVHLGLGYGPSGVALFFLRLFEMSGDEKWLRFGRQALLFDISHGVELEPGIVTFPRGVNDTTVDPYLEEGSAGIARVALRFGMFEKAESMLLDAHRKYSVFAGLLYGTTSFVDIFTDARQFLDDDKYRQMARRPLAGIRDMYLLKYQEGWATPGDGLFRVSCDYATGVAGVLRAFDRAGRLDAADFSLDEIGRVAVPRNASLCTLGVTR